MVFQTCFNTPHFLHKCTDLCKNYTMLDHRSGYFDSRLCGVFIHDRMLAQHEEKKAAPSRYKTVLTQWINDVIQFPSHCNVMYNTLPIYFLCRDSPMQLRANPSTPYINTPLCDKTRQNPRLSVEYRLSHVSTEIPEPTFSEVKSACSDDCAPELNCCTNISLSVSASIQEQKIAFNN